MELGRVLVADDSRVVRALLDALLSPSAAEVRTAATLAEALAELDAPGRFDLVIADVLYPDGHGLDLLDHVRRSKPQAEQPAVLFMTARPDEADRAVAHAAGALGYLPKPVRMAQIRELWTRIQSGEWHDRAPRVRCKVPVIVQDPGSLKEDVFACVAHDVSRTGAFLETEGPLPIGQVSLVLDPEGVGIPLQAMVVRVQGPSWDHVAGVGVHFLDPDPEAQANIDRLLERASRDAERA